MHPISIRIRNYRNFSPSHIEFEIKEGITFILGLNNTGKSNILRFLFEMRGILQELSRYTSSASSNIRFNASPGFFFDNIVTRTNMREPIDIEISTNQKLLRLKIAPPNIESNLHTNTFLVTGTRSSPFSPNDLLPLSDTLYIGPFRSATAKVAGPQNDITIGIDFVRTWSQWAGGDTVEHRQKISTLIQELQEIFAYRRFNINVNDTKDNLLITTDDGQFTLDELGGGVSHFIIVLGNALIRNPLFILIDEPEIGLHPRMQEVFVRVLATKAEAGLIASSHSIGLARSTADYILSLTKTPDRGLTLNPFGEHHTPTISQSLHEMGYSQFTEIGGNKILLVEGRTDIKAFREILRKFGTETNFIILSFGGAQFINKDRAKIIDELSEIKRLNAKSVSVIFDSNRTSATMALSPPLEEFQTCCKELKFNVFPTDRHSTENYITQEALDKVLGKGYQALTEYEDFNTRAISKWDKGRNWLMFREMKKEDFNSTTLKDFIEEIIEQ